MLQELTFGRLENEFYDREATASDLVICVRNNRILLKRIDENNAEYPTVEAIDRWAKENEWTTWKEDKFRYIFRMQDVNYFLWMGEGGETKDSAFQYEEIGQLRQVEIKEICFAAYTAIHLFNWYWNNQFCGRCQTPTVHDTRERMLRCPNCGNMIFPKISPAVIIAVTDGNRLLLSKYAGRAYTRYALLAGYTEIGETIEETVQREVMEEVGLKVKNIRYYKSQPWSFSNTLLLGFFCDLDGDEKIRLDREELAMAEWFEREDIPEPASLKSLTAEMIMYFKNNKDLF